MSTSQSLPAVSQLLPLNATSDTHGPQLHAGLRIALVFADRLVPALQDIPVTISTACHSNACGLMFVSAVTGRAIQIVARNNASCATMFIGNDLQFSFPARIPAEECQYAHFTEDEMGVYLASAAAHLRGAEIMNLHLNAVAEMRQELLSQKA